MESILPALKSVAAGVSIGGGIHVLFRSPRAQRLWIRRTMQRQAEQLRCKVAARDWTHFPRSKFIGLLHEQLAKEPVGPVVLTGPEGAGTSGIAEAGMALSGSPLLLHVNLRERAASGDRTLFWQMVRSSGYYVMNREMADIGLGRFTGIDAYDIEACMTAYAEVCQHERDARDAGSSWWRRLLWGSETADAEMRKRASCCSGLLLLRLGEPWARKIMESQLLSTLLKQLVGSVAVARNNASWTIQLMLELLPVPFALKLEQVGAIDTLCSLFLNSDSAIVKPELYLNMVLRAAEAEPEKLFQTLASFKIREAFESIKGVSA